MAIGRGIEALIPHKRREKPRSTTAPQGESVFLVDVEDLHPNPWQPRREFDRSALKELADSIAEYGILQPLVVQKIQEDTSSGTRVRYQLIAGERRLRAAKMADLPRVPVVIRKETDDRTQLELSLIENVQREDLNAIERAQAFQKLISKFGFSQKTIAERIHKSRELVANTLRLLELPQAMQESTGRGEITEGHARAILSLQDERARLILFEEIRKGKMSVRAAEAQARALQTKAPILAADSTRAELEQRLKEALNAPVRITHRGKKGNISIGYNSQEERDRIVDKICH